MLSRWHDQRSEARTFGVAVDTLGDRRFVPRVGHADTGQDNEPKPNPLLLRRFGVHN